MQLRNFEDNNIKNQITEPVILVPVRLLRSVSIEGYIISTACEY